MKAKSASEHLERVNFSAMDKNMRNLATRRANRLDEIDELFFTLRSERRGIVEFLKSLPGYPELEEPATPQPKYGMTPERYRELNGKIPSPLTTQ